VAELDYLFQLMPGIARVVGVVDDMCIHEPYAITTVQHHHQPSEAAADHPQTLISRQLLMI